MILKYWSVDTSHLMLIATDDEMRNFMNYSRLVDKKVFADCKMETVHNGYLVLKEELASVKEFMTIYGGIDETQTSSESKETKV